jgi:hypothetical protein
MRAGDPKTQKGDGRRSYRLLIVMSPEKVVTSR